VFALSLGGSPANTDDNELFYHRGTALDGYQLDHVIPVATTGVEHEINSTSTTVKFYTKNMTSDARFGDSGDDPYELDHRPAYYTTPGGQGASVTILVEEVSNDGQTVIETIDSYTTTWGSETNCNQANFLDQTYSSGRNIDAQNRLRISIIYVGGPANSVTLCFDEVNSDSNSKMRFRDDEGSENVNIPFPSWPVSYTGGDVKLEVNNPGPSGLWFSHPTRVVFNDTASDTSYSAFLYEYSETDDLCNSSNCDVDWDRDTRFVKIGETIKLIFNEPNTRPLHSGGDGTAITPGTYTVFIHLRGYDEEGQLYFQIANYGIISY